MDSKEVKQEVSYNTITIELLLEAVKELITKVINLTEDKKDISDLEAINKRIKDI